jgi:hypothetical protein
MADFTSLIHGGLNDLRKGKGPFIGPRGGKWADAKHTIAWKEDGGKSGGKKFKPDPEYKLSSEGHNKKDYNRGLKEGMSSTTIPQTSEKDKKDTSYMAGLKQGLMVQIKAKDHAKARYKMLRERADRGEKGGIPKGSSVTEKVYIEANTDAIMENILSGMEPDGKGGYKGGYRKASTTFSDLAKGKPTKYLKRKRGKGGRYEYTYAEDGKPKKKKGRFGNLLSTLMGVVKKHPYALMGEFKSMVRDFDLDELIEMRSEIKDALEAKPEKKAPGEKKAPKKETAEKKKPAPKKGPSEKDILRQMLKAIDKMIAKKQEANSKLSLRSLVAGYHKGDTEAIKELYKRAQELLPGIRISDALNVVATAAENYGKLPKEFVDEMIRENRVKGKKPPAAATEEAPKPAAKYERSKWADFKSQMASSDGGAKLNRQYAEFAKNALKATSKKDLKHAIEQAKAASRKDDTVVTRTGVGYSTGIKGKLKRLQAHLENKLKLVSKYGESGLAKESEKKQKEKKPVTPQVPAMEGMAPLGIAPKPAGEDIGVAKERGDNRYKSSGTTDKATNHDEIIAAGGEYLGQGVYTDKGPPKAKRGKKGKVEIVHRGEKKLTDGTIYGKGDWAITKQLESKRVTVTNIATGHSIGGEMSGPQASYLMDQVMELEASGKLDGFDPDNLSSSSSKPAFDALKKVADEVREEGNSGMPIWSRRNKAKREANRRAKVEKLTEAASVKGVISRPLALADVKRKEHKSGEAAHKRARNFQSTDEFRLNLQQSIVDRFEGEQYMISTDGHRMALIPVSNDVKQGVGYGEGSRDALGGGREFPNYKQVIPDDRKANDTHDFDAETLLAHAKLGASTPGVMAGYVHLYADGGAHKAQASHSAVISPEVDEREKGMAGIALAESKRPSTAGEPTGGDSKSISVNARYLVDALEGAKGSVSVYYKDKGSQMIIERADGEIHVIMPVRDAMPKDHPHRTEEWEVSPASKSFTNFSDLFKAKPTKYKTRKRGKDGRWVYTYAEKKAPKSRMGAFLNKIVGFFSEHHDKEDNLIAAEKKLIYDLETPQLEMLRDAIKAELAAMEKKPVPGAKKKKPSKKRSGAPVTAEKKGPSRKQILQQLLAKIDGELAARAIVGSAPTESEDNFETMPDEESIGHRRAREVMAMTVSDASRLASEEPGTPLRAPHHTTSTQGLLGELDQAQGGILFLDQIEDFSLESIKKLAVAMRDNPYVMIGYRTTGTGTETDKVKLKARLEALGVDVSMWDANEGVSEDNFETIQEHYSAKKQLLRDVDVVRASKLNELNVPSHSEIMDHAVNHSHYRHVKPAFKSAKEKIDRLNEALAALGVREWRGYKIKPFASSDLDDLIAMRDQIRRDEEALSARVGLVSVDLPSNSMIGREHPEVGPQIREEREKLEEVKSAIAAYNNEGTSEDNFETMPEATTPVSQAHEENRLDAELRSNNTSEQKANENIFTYAENALDPDSLKFVIEWSESGAVEDGQEFASVNELNAKLQEISDHHRERYGLGGGYFKTKVYAELEGNRFFGNRLDVTSGGEDVNLVDHMTAISHYYQSDRGREYWSAVQANQRDRGEETGEQAHERAQSYKNMVQLVRDHQRIASGYDIAGGDPPQVKSKRELDKLSETRRAQADAWEQAEREAEQRAAQDAHAARTAGWEAPQSRREVTKRVKRAIVQATGLPAKDVSVRGSTGTAWGWVRISGKTQAAQAAIDAFQGRTYWGNISPDDWDRATLEFEIGAGIHTPGSISRGGFTNFSDLLKSIGRA